MNHHSNSKLPFTIQQLASLYTTNDSTVNLFNCPNLLPTEQSNPQIQISEVETFSTLENPNAVKGKHLKKYQQHYLTPTPYNYSGYWSSEDDTGYYSDSHLMSIDPVTPLDDDNGYLSDSLLWSQTLNSQSTSTSPSPSVLSASYDDNVFFPNQYNEWDGHISDSQINDGYLSESSMSSPQQTLYQHTNGLYINTIDQFALNPQFARSLTRKPKKNVTSACLNCKNSHAKCDIQRPCRRCREKCMTCGPTQNRRRGRKPRQGSTPSTPEPTSPISPSCQSTAQKPF
ncbi:13828_t:CDS:1 [Dentiscutata erythropus]|uniref:13828_t:CDS:1 n=1 Tax=Dentiscutata erythropus TaxID=1348616 RepID=A0A9N9E940_9GLOM|nr:13828_t:CDS:1 [Dentiscutata erythropus]